VKGERLGMEGSVPLLATPGASFATHLKRSWHTGITLHEALSWKR